MLDPGKDTVADVLAASLPDEEGPSAEEREALADPDGAGHLGSS